MRKTLFVPALILILPLIACRNSSGDDPSDTPAGFHVAPAQLDACDPPSEVAMTWNISSSHPETSEVQIWVTPPGEESQLFAEGGPIDHARTGAWAKPGMAFALKAKGSDTELFRAVLDGPECL